jgi:hypothetical protein
VSGADDAYGPPVSGGLFYEVRDLFPVAIHPQLRVSYSLFSSQEEGYGASSMLSLGVGALFEFARFGSADLPIALGATAGYKHYLRWLDRDSEAHTTFRPKPYAGMEGRLAVGNSALGARSTIEVAMDNSPRALLGLELYYGYEFGGNN